MTDNDIERALRYRNYAEELRLIAAEGATPAGREALHMVAKEYDQMASSVDAIARSKDAARRERP